jgi:streptomycin 6-kinase
VDAASHGGRRERPGSPTADLVRNAVAAWGPAGRAFVDGLPETVAAVARDWELTLGQPYPMSFHWVCRVRTADGGSAVLKLAPPGLDHVVAEVASLRHFDGIGAVRLLAYDPARGAFLVEPALPGTSASALVPSRDLVATAAIITVARRLHRPVSTVDAVLPDLLARDRQSFVDHLRRYPGDEPVPRRLVTRALGLLAELCASATVRVVLHGDLHHDNVLRASDGPRGRSDPWLAIDPHGVVGDPGAEIGAMLYNPDPPRRDPALLALVPARLEQLADGLALPYDRVLAWGFVQAVLSEVWTAEDSHADVTRALDVALALEPRLS